MSLQPDILENVLSNNGTILSGWSSEYKAKDGERGKLCD